MKKIPVKVNATKEQIQHMEYLKGNKSKLHNNQGQPLPYSKLGKYLIDNFGDKISEALFNENKDDAITKHNKLG